MIKSPNVETEIYSHMDGVALISALRDIAHGWEKPRNINIIIVTGILFIWHALCMWGTFTIAVWRNHGYPVSYTLELQKNPLRKCTHSCIQAKFGLCGRVRVLPAKAAGLN